MPIALVAAALFVLAFGRPATAASGVACDRASTAVETRICATPALRDLDGRLARAFGARERSTPAGDRLRLRADQRAWLARRDATCPTAHPACLEAEMSVRLAQLAPSAGAPRPGRGPTALHGVWRVGALLDPQGAGAPPAADVASELRVRELPPFGATVAARHGDVCTGDLCRSWTWRARSAAQVMADNRIAPLAGLKPGAPGYVLLDDQDALGVVLQMRDGRLLFPLNLCDTRNEACRTGFQPWTPASPDARLGPA